MMGKRSRASLRFHYVHFLSVQQVIFILCHESGGAAKHQDRAFFLKKA